MWDSETRFIFVQLFNFDYADLFVKIFLFSDSLFDPLYQMIAGQLPFYDRNHEQLFEKILRSDVVYPPFMSPRAVDLISQLMKKNPEERLGNGPGDTKDIQAHPFFAKLDFNEVMKCNIKPLFIPKVKDAGDTSNFDAMFTNEVARMSPTEGVVFQDAHKEAVFKSFE